MDTTAERSFIFFRTRDELLRVDLRHVVYFKADRNYTELHFLNGATALLDTSIGNIEDLLNRLNRLGRIPPFARIGRSHIVSLRHIFRIDILHQRLVLTDLQSPTIYDLCVPKEALKKLKDLYSTKQWKLS